jgi:hypothetical protein
LPFNGQRSPAAAQDRIGGRLVQCVLACDRVIDYAIDGQAGEMTQCEWNEGHFSLRQRRLLVRLSRRGPRRRSATQ